MAIHIGRLNGGDITVGTSGSVLDATKTRFTLEGGTVETYDITGTLDESWMIENGYFDEDEGWTKTITQADIGNTVTSIGDGAFTWCSSLTSVTIPNSVIDIGYGAFNSCRGLTSVTIPASVTSINEGAFDECSSLTSITVLGKTTTQAQTLLANASVPEGCTIVGELG